MPIYLNGFLCALTLLTILPIPKKYHEDLWSSQNGSHVSVYFYSLIGLIIGAILSALQGAFHVFLSPDLPAIIEASCIVLVWVILTGALHLDGLADAFDAACASHKGRDRVLQILRDPCAGPIGVMALILCILFKVILVSVLLTMNLNDLILFVLVPAMARLSVAYYMMCTPYARDNGIVQVSSQKINGVVLSSISAVFFIAISVLSSVPFALLLVLILSIFLFVWRTYWLKLIGGYTGDGLGAFIEISEVLVLLMICLRFYS